MELAPNRTLVRWQIENKMTQQNLKNPSEAADNESEGQKLKRAADGFEELFVHKMFQVMRESNPKTGLTTGGRGEEIFQDMLDQNYAELITKSEALGLSKMIVEHTKEP